MVNFGMPPGGMIINAKTINAKMRQFGNCRKASVGMFFAEFFLHAQRSLEDTPPSRCARHLP